MSNMKKMISQGFIKICRGIPQRIREVIIEREDEACFYERQNDIANAVVAMHDAGLNDETITSMLQKYWDLRRSEATNFIEWAHSRIPGK